MDKDYKNFIDRMGSFEDNIELSDDQINKKDNDCISHYGVLGMRWGVRRGITSNSVGATARTGQSLATLGQTINRNKNNKKTIEKAKKLTDDELKQITSRLELENRYVNSKSQQQGKSKVESILSTAGSSFAVVSSAALMVDAIKKAKG